MVYNRHISLGTYLVSTGKSNSWNATVYPIVIFNCALLKGELTKRL